MTDQAALVRRAKRGDRKAIAALIHSPIRIAPARRVRRKPKARPKTKMSKKAAHSASEERHQMTDAEAVRLARRWAERTPEARSAVLAAILTPADLARASGLSDLHEGIVPRAGARLSTSASLTCKGGKLELDQRSAFTKLEPDNKTHAGAPVEPEHGPSQSEVTESGRARSVSWKARRRAGALTDVKVLGILAAKVLPDVVQRPICKGL